MTEQNILSKSEIYDIIDKLYKSIGLRLDVSVKLPDVIVTKNNFLQFCNIIIKQLELPIIVSPNFSGNFQSTGLTKIQDTNTTSGVGAQITIPGNLPQYGSPFLIGFNIEVHVMLGCGEPYPILTQLSHEFSHIYLYSNHDEQKESEYATDICALMMGFGPIWEKGRKTVKTYSETRGIREQYKYTTTTTSTLGYLSDSEYKIALKYISDLRNPIVNLRNKIKVVLEKIHKCHSEIKDKIAQLFELVEYHYNHKCNVKRNDINFFSQISQPRFRIDLEETLEHQKEEINKIVKVLNKQKVFKAYDEITLNNYLHILNMINNNMNIRLAEINKYISIIKRNLSIKCRINRLFKKKIAEILSWKKQD